ncbi:MAG: hypothetical protein Q7R47_02435, partial [Candidatus Diapherotrites archaeon]|nr:hypothetical protein [Candidatus Diapherotrites archaeon]
SKKDLLGDEKKWQHLLSTLSPDIVVVPNRFSTDSTDRWARKVGLAYAKTKKRCVVWSFETDRGLFEPTACDLVFEFGTDMMLSKLAAVRRLSHLRHLRLDVSAKSLAVFRKLALLDRLSENGVRWHSNRFCEWFGREKGSSGEVRK